MSSSTFPVVAAAGVTPISATRNASSPMCGMAIVSERSAREDYGVVINTQGWTVDEAATAALRAGI